MLCESSPTSTASCGDKSPTLGFDDMSLPTLPRRFLDDAERAAFVNDEPETDVPEVESREPAAEFDVPAVMLVEDDEPRLNGLVLGKGTS